MATSKPKQPAYSIRKNQWENWYGYESGRRVIEFYNTSTATMEQNAKAWLERVTQAAGVAVE